MLSFDKAQEIINREIDSLVMDHDPVELYQPVKYILSIGGKRIRPALVLMSCSMFSGQVIRAIKPALAIEIFHNFTLLHDDIMDNSVLRRNQPTVHEKWNKNIAILSGDAMSILSYQFIADCSSDILPDVIRLFTSTALEVCEGQQYDMNYESRENINVDDYIRMVTLKTSVLLAASMKLGAMIGGASSTDSDLMYESGKNLGIAFQIRDDILDVYGDTGKFGKKIGTDIIANKKTYLIIKTLEEADGEAGSILRKLISTKEIDPDEKITTITGIFDRLGIREMAEVKTKEYYNKALKAFDQVSIDTRQKKTIIDFARQLMEREA